ncbi:hypothetical protein RB213_011920 [Colletotrichum asianum]
MSVHSSPNEELHNDLNEDATFTPSDMWQSEDEDNEGEDGGARGTTRETQRWAIDHSTGHHRLQAKDFKSTDALKMMQEKHTINFRSRRAGCTQARPSDGFFLAKHVSRIPFDVTRRTFRIAQASTRETWFIVMYPVTGEMSELLSSTADARRRREQAGEKSGMLMPLACELASYITGVFQSPALLSEGIQRSWRPSGQESQQISSNQWMAFQEAFIEGWAAWSGRHSGATHEPAFYAYDYRANIEIEVSEELYDLPRERHCAMDDSEDEEDGEETGGGQVDDNDDDETLQLEELSVADDGPRRAEVEGVAGAHGCTRSSRGGINHARYQRIFDECDGLQKLVSELETWFQLENITAILYALAVCINSDRTTEANRLETHCLLADRNMLAREFASTCNYTFYPQAFHPVYRNVSSNCPPIFLNLLFAAMKGNMSDQNEGADVLSFGYFQGYSNIKRSVRHSPHDLLATKGYATGALTVPTLDTGATSAAREKRERLLRIIRGPNESKPFARERQQIDVAVEAKEVAFQLKQVMSLDVRRMTGAERTFKTVIRPIFQIIRFFLVEHKSFVHIFRSLPLKIFPRIMCAYLQLFELVLNEIERQFVLGGEQGLNLARSEAVAVVDRLGGRGQPQRPRLRRGRHQHRPVAPLRQDRAAYASARLGTTPLLQRPSCILSGECHLLGEHAFASKTAVAAFAEELVHKLWVPQTRTFIMQQLRRRLHEGGGDPGRPITMENIASCETTMAAWEAAPDAFTWKALQRLCRGLRLGGERVAIAVSKQRTRHDFVAELLRVIGSEKGRDSFAAKNATWPLTLHFAIINGRKLADGIDVEIWVAVVTGCFLAASIKWVPNSVRGRLTSRSIVRLGGQATVQPAPFGPPGSLRRAAREAEIKHERTVKDWIDFSCPLPFTNIPSLILASFNQTKAIFLGKGDAKVLDHYQIAINCLAEKIDDLLCHLMLMIMLTICASSKTPEAKNSGRTAYDVMEMMKKIEHKGCSNHMLRELG